MIKSLHSYWAYLVLLLLLLAVYRALYGAISKKEYTPKMFQVALFTLIVTHIQLLIALFEFEALCFNNLKSYQRNFSQ